jgi:RNA-binding protein
MPLTNTQRQYLRRLAHDRKVTVQLGKQGLTPAVLDSVEIELNTRELIKLKFMDFREEKRELAEEIASDTSAEFVAMIGNIAILYREQRDPEKRTVILPR